jgi:hypothetical protein
VKREEEREDRRGERERGGEKRRKEVHMWKSTGAIDGCIIKLRKR